LSIAGYYSVKIANDYGCTDTAGNRNYSIQLNGITLTNNSTIIARIHGMSLMGHELTNPLDLLEDGISMGE